MGLLLISKILVLFTFLAVILPNGYSFSFNFPSFRSNDHNISVEGDASVSRGAIHLTPTSGSYHRITGRLGRATHQRPVFLTDHKTGNLLDFTTEFSFIIKPLYGAIPSGDGLTFFMAESDSVLPPKSGGGYLGLIDPKNPRISTPIIAVEFDTFSNSWDTADVPHVGIDVNSIVSVKSTAEIFSGTEGEIAHVRISYAARDMNLEVFLYYGDSKKNPVYGNPILSYIVDLRKILPTACSRIGFSASTGTSVELHQILSWKFSSSIAK